MAISEPRAASPYAGHRMSLDDFLRLPEQQPPLEYDDGMVTPKMSPELDHNRIARTMCDEMQRIASERQIGLAEREVRFRGGRASYVPDVSYYRTERLRWRGARRFARLQDAPDIAVEVASPGQSVTALIRRCLRYLELGARISVLVDPEDEAALVFRSGPSMLVLQGDDRIDLDDVLPGFDLTVRRVFDSIAPEWMARYNARPRRRHEHGDL